MRTKNRLVVGLTIGFVGASLPLVVGCSSETTSSGGGGGGSGGAVPSGGVSGTAGAPSGGTAGAATGGSSTGGVSGTGPTGGSAGTAAGSGGAGTSSGGTGGAGNGGTTSGGAGSGGTPGGAGGSAGSGGSGGTAGSGGAGGFTLTSPDHMNGAMFADPYTCAEAGFNGSILPELRWSGAPAGTMSFAITFIDRTLAARGEMNGYHWVIWNIPAATMSLPEGFKDQASIMAQENRDFLGPCPNFGGGSANTDTYEFTIYALSQASIMPTGNMTAIVLNAETMLEANNLAKAKLSGTSNASP